MKTKNYLSIVGIAFASMTGQLYAQTSLKGRVIDQNNQPVVGATVTDNHTKVQAITDRDGSFSITVKEENPSITVKFIGFEMHTITDLKDGTVTVRLVPEADELTEVVVTALGISREKRALGYAVQEVRGVELQTRPTNALSALSGKVAGMQVTSSGGNMGGSTRVTLRGINSISGNNQPLYIVDGTPLDDRDLNSSATINGSAGKDVGNLIQDINPDDIADISVLKGPVSAALYGSRAANGVIMITTKKAKLGEQTSISLHTGMDFEQIVRLPSRQKLYGQGYATAFQTVNINGMDYKIVDYASDESWGPKLDGTPVLQWYSLNPEDASTYLQATPWVYPKNDVNYFFRTGLANTNNLAIAGSGGQTSYRLSYTNKNVRGTTPNSTLGRNSLNFSGSTQLGKLRVSSVLNYVNNQSLGKPWAGASNRNIMLEAFQWGAVQVDYKLLENYKRADGTPLAWNRTGWQNTPAAEATRFIDNPYWSAYESYMEEQRDRIYGNVGLDYQATSWLNLQAKVHGDVYSFSSEDRIAVYSRSASQYEEAGNNLNEYNYEFIATAKKQWQDFSLNALIGGNIRDMKRKVNYAVTQGGLIIPNYYNLKNASSVLTENYRYQRRIGSLFGSASLGYRDVLYLDATVRNDWSSTLPSNNYSYFYPSVSGSFVFSQLDAIRQVDWISFAKVRAGVSWVGNDTDPYMLNKVYSAEQAFAGVPSYSLPAVLNNANLKPEITQSWEAGLNMQFFQNRLGFDVTYYNNTTRDQILPVPVSSAFGYESKVLNAGRVDNKGVEIILNATPIRKENFQWNTNINWARNVNKVVKLDDLVNTLSLSNTLVNLVAREGQPYGQLLGYDFVYANDGQRVVQADGTYMRTSQLVPLGSVLPKFLFGFQNNFVYKNFNLGFLVDGRVGGKFFSQTYKVGMYAGILDKTAADNVRETGVVLDGVKADVTFDPDGTYHVSNPVENDTRITAQQWARNEYNGPTTFSIFDATFIKLREVTLGYTIPLKDTKLIKNLGLSVYGRNLWNIYTTSKYIDPEFTSSGGNVQGIEGGNIPVPITFGFNVNVKF
ncbi:SusC/RagA family TonB-linked outer membrane protein [Sphingobacterium griseoflavum]|uniref:SusC/RagA family TonB-linked outer membrane protein n=1 Tax=Sphingobacterium griseoflavum TaxID=1474952 RepID=A0ABQ3HUP3_9SPHI|nr:SusC/RagA family TonB-linked outer membrane protein [Sphingobacterium griseoflavum]GHE23537.1 SusC/RagA family TonB-linked outer membrane protein [Sphingobacterium griseoflavum]